MPWRTAVLAGVCALCGIGPAPAAEEERGFGEAGDWAVLAGLSDGNLRYCAAARAFDGRPVRLQLTGEVWTLNVGTGDASGDLSAFDIDGTSYPPDAARNGQDIAIRLTQDGLEAVRNGRLARVTLDGAAIDIPLNGTAAAALRVLDCIRLAGIAPGPVELATPDTPAPLETGPLGDDCPPRAQAKSTWDGPPVALTLRYAAVGAAPALQLYWVDPFGRLLPVPLRLDGGAEVTWDSYAGQTFIARDADGICRGGLLRAAPGATYTIR